MRWSELWLKKIVAWLEHLWRHKENPAYKVLVCQDDDWLRHARALSGRSRWHGTVEAGALCLRGGPGRPIRWGQGWMEHMEPENPQKDIQISRENFMRLYAITEHGRWQGEVVELAGGG